MRFLIDEDVPTILLSVLKTAGHDTLRVEPSTSDPAIAARAKTEGRILVTLDKDFTNTTRYPPSQFTIVHIQIHPPYAQDITAAFKRLLETLPTEKFRGLIILQKPGSIRVVEEA